MRLDRGAAPAEEQLGRVRDDLRVAEVEVRRVRDRMPRGQLREEPRRRHGQRAANGCVRFT
jgi:hypothetical protein